MNKIIISILFTMISIMPFSVYADIGSKSLCESELLNATQTLSNNHSLSDEQKNNLKKCLRTAYTCNAYASQYNCQFIYNEITKAAMPPLKIVNTPIPSTTTKSNVMTNTPPNPQSTVSTQPIANTKPIAPMNANANITPPPNKNINKTPTETPQKNEQINWL